MNRKARDAAIAELFSHEVAALEAAEEALAREAESPTLKQTFSQLLEHYRRLLRQTMKLTHLSDATQLELRRTSDELKAAMAEVDELNAERDEIFAMTVHDLRSPLAGIVGLARLLRESPEGAEEAEREEIGEDIDSLGSGMLGLIDDLVDLYKMERDESSLRIEAFTCDNLLEAMEGRFGARAREKLISLSLYTETPNAVLHLDLGHVRRILENLLSNALKFSPKGTAVIVRLSCFDDWLNLQVTDHGPGISAAEQARLFRKFARGSARPTAGETSTGLGLAIVKRLVEQMHGEIAVDSSLGAGSTFTIRLPARLEPGTAPERDFLS